MNDWPILLLVPALFFIVWFWPELTRRLHLAQPFDDADLLKRNKYHAVSFQPCPYCCEAVIALKDKRFLAAEAATLPLTSCDAPVCKCTYKHYADRRTGQDRRHASAIMETAYSAKEHREGKERRKQHAYQ